jgi:hypothetical protein
MAGRFKIQITGGSMSVIQEKPTKEVLAPDAPHIAHECLDLTRLLNAQGYLWNSGCKAGVHSGWTFIDAEDEAVARLAVPALVPQSGSHR